LNVTSTVRKDPAAFCENSGAAFLGQPIHESHGEQLVHRAKALIDRVEDLARREGRRNDD